MQSSSRFNYYEILELSSNAPQHEVTTAYERARSTYSGENPAIYTIFSEFEAREFLTFIEEAYKVLGNKTLRLIYDQRLRGGYDFDDLSYNSLLEARGQMFPETKPEKKSSSYTIDEAFEKEIAAQTEWDGDFIKKVREYKNLSLHQVHDITKINAYYIDAVEKMDSASLPVVVFVRGYVVQIAKALGLNDKKVADSYMKIFKERFGK